MPFKPNIPDSTITREMLIPRMRNPKGVQNTLTRVYTKVATSATPSPIVLQYEATTQQTLTVERGEYGFLSLDFPTASVPNAGVSGSPFEWTVDTDRQATIEAVVEIDKKQLTGFILAVRVNGCDVDSSCYVVDNSILRVISEITVLLGDVVTVEFRALNLQAYPQQMTVESGSISVVSR